MTLDLMSLLVGVTLGITLIMLADLIDDWRLRMEFRSMTEEWWELYWSAHYNLQEVRISRAE